MSKKKVVLIGACGRMASLIIQGLRENYDLVPVDLRTTDDSGREVEGVLTLDLLQQDRSQYREVFRDAHAVIHSGFVRSPDADPDTRFRNEYANVGMAYNVYQASVEANVRRVIMVSSNHAADYYEPLILEGEWDFVDPEDRALSDNYYGWAKEVYEHLGFVFAVGKPNQSPLENVQIRIGGPRETDVEKCQMGDLVRMRRALAVYLSQRDMLQLFVKSIETKDIRNQQGVPFQIFYGISDNPHAFWSIANARRVIDYQPQDNSERRFADLIAAHLKAAEKRK
jgi:nucleoside-diphosphate-sugar epimerase